MDIYFWRFYGAIIDENDEIFVDDEPIYLSATVIAEVIPEGRIARVLTTLGNDYTVRRADVLLFLQSFGAVVS